MGQPAAFAPQGKSISFTTNATPSTSQSRLILLSDIGLGFSPTVVHVYNVGTALVWINFAAASGGSVVIPTPGTTTVGTPQIAYPLVPGAIEVFSFALPWTAQAGLNSPVGFYLQDISASASQTYHLTFGEGV